MLPCDGTWWSYKDVSLWWHLGELQPAGKAYSLGSVEKVRLLIILFFQGFCLVLHPQLISTMEIHLFLRTFASTPLPLAVPLQLHA